MQVLIENTGDIVRLADVINFRSDDWTTKDLLEEYGALGKSKDDIGTTFVPINFLSEHAKVYKNEPYDYIADSTTFDLWQNTILNLNKVDNILASRPNLLTEHLQRSFDSALWLGDIERISKVRLDIATQAIADIKIMQSKDSVSMRAELSPHSNSNSISYGVTGLFNFIHYYNSGLKIYGEFSAYLTGVFDNSNIHENMNIHVDNETVNSNKLLTEQQQYQVRKLLKSKLRSHLKQNGFKIGRGYGDKAVSDAIYGAKTIETLCDALNEHEECLEDNQTSINWHFLPAFDDEPVVDDIVYSYSNSKVLMKGNIWHLVDREEFETLQQGSRTR